MQESVTFFGFGFGGEFGGRKTEGVVDEGCYEGVHGADSGVEGTAGNKGVEGPVWC